MPLAAHPSRTRVNPRWPSPLPAATSPWRGFFSFLRSCRSSTQLGGPGHSPGPVVLLVLIRNRPHRDAAVQGLQIKPEREALPVGVRPRGTDGLPFRIPVLAPVADPVRDVRRPP